MSVAEQLKPLSAADLFAKILRQEALFILDVRNEEAYADWKIEGGRVQSLNMPYFDLLDGPEPVLPKLPQNQPILVACAKEGSSRFVGEQLVEAGVSDVFYLVGGMKSWSEYLYPVKVGDLTAGGALYQFVRVGKGCLSYAIVSGGEVAFVDTARTLDPYLEFAEAQDVKIRYTIDTHLHADHISGGRRLAERVGATYLLPPKDAVDVAFAFAPLQEGYAFSIGKTTVQVQPLYSPGHTIGSTSLIIDDTYLLSGDTLFVQSIGRPDLAGKAEDWVNDLRETLYLRYKHLPGALLVLPAHYGTPQEMDADGRVAERLDQLFATNASLQIQDEASFRTAVTKNLPPQPHAYQDIRLVNMGKLERPELEQSEMEIGPNRCAVHG